MELIPPDKIAENLEPGKLTSALWVGIEEFI